MTCTRRRMLIVPMHETTTGTECGGCPMQVETDHRGSFCAAFDTEMESSGFDRELGLCRFSRLPACLTAEEAAQE